jgi:AraC-like DNA-binding protein
MKAKLLEFIIKLCRFYTAYQKKEKFNVDMIHKRDALFKVFEFVSEKYLDKIGLNDLAEVMHLQPNYFSRIFKEKTGKTPMEYVTEYRINKACDYLSHSDMDITSIAFEVGFNDSSYFAKIFREVKGVSPKKFRKKLRK